MTKDWVHVVGLSPVCQILSQIVVRAVITSSPHAWTSSAGMLSTPADFPFFNDCTAASTSLRRMGWSSSVSVWVQFSVCGGGGDGGGGGVCVCVCVCEGVSVRAVCVVCVGCGCSVG